MTGIDSVARNRPWMKNLGQFSGSMYIGPLCIQVTMQRPNKLQVISNLFKLCSLSASSRSSRCLELPRVVLGTAATLFDDDDDDGCCKSMVVRRTKSAEAILYSIGICICMYEFSRLLGAWFLLNLTRFVNHCLPRPVHPGLLTSAALSETQSFTGDVAPLYFIPRYLSFALVAAWDGWCSYRWRQCRQLTCSVLGSRNSEKSRINDSWGHGKRHACQTTIL
jgi:hypothetical protein